MIDAIISIYPELEGMDLQLYGVYLRDDSDGDGVYITKWEYSKPLPDGLKIGK